MFYKLFVVTLLICIGIGYVCWDQVRTPTTANNLILDMTLNDNNAIVPNIAFRSLDGDLYNLHDFKGKIVLLNFWATWCAPCIAEFPELLKLAKEKKEDVVLIAMSVDEKIESIKPFLERHDFDTNLDNVIIVHDAGKAISQDIFQTSTYPETFTLAPNLTIAKKINGFVEWNNDEEIQILLNTLIRH
jgi:thiol-disulfide isomerase/thioredoxin